MKTKHFVFSFLIGFLFVINVKAQNDPIKGIVDILGKQVGMGDVMGQLVGGIKPSAFNSDWGANKSNFLNELAGTNASDYLKYASLAGQLSGFLKETSFLPGWATQKDGILDQLQKAGSIADVAGGLSSMSSLISPSSLTKSFKKKKGSFDTALGLLSKLK